MKKVSWMLPSLWLCFLLLGCAAGAIPKGSRWVGTYKGVLWGNVFDGPIQVQVFETPEGGTVFTGHFVETLVGGEYHFRGTVSGNWMEGKISLGFGTITGELSEDRTRMSGTFRLAQTPGTWSASLE